MTHATPSVRLKTLVAEGLVERTPDPDIPQKVEYSLTEIGEKFRPALDAIAEWGMECIEFLKQNNS